ncbi:hypothetical protein F7725_007263 [Dissostichus mawsoni]|uniref:Uncharacterized protein n=1 Tax=Dissostichus mawsoni TaxID=36200 RepID=A0A7J5XWY6_DISMA|nr:hypothetical protein F7725_007263 [Dissostichus mawsoni]
MSPPVIWTTVHEFTKAVVLVCGRMRAVCLRTLMHVIKIDVSSAFFWPAPCAAILLICVSAVSPSHSDGTHTVWGEAAPRCVRAVTLLLSIHPSLSHFLVCIQLAVTQYVPTAHSPPSLTKEQEGMHRAEFPPPVGPYPSTAALH